MAWDMRERGRELAAEWERRGWQMPLRIGAAMGHATIGAIGFEERLDYGVVGRVNRLAAALCNAAEGGHILVSQKIAAAAEGWADLVEIDLAAPSGTTRSIRAFKVLGLK
jgi:class 3 adenylate cyclase